ncbi:MAG: glycosyltransferase family 2 protein [Rhizobiaceae bacterium]
MHENRDTAADFLSPKWRKVFQAAGLGSAQISALVNRARADGSTLHEELALWGSETEKQFYRALAAELELPFRDQIDPEKLAIPDKDLLGLVENKSGPKLVFYRDMAAENRVLISPEFFDFGDLKDYLNRYPKISDRIDIVAPKSLREALLKKAQPLLAGRAVAGLFERYPQLSARIVANAMQGFSLGLIAALILFGLLFYPSLAIAALHCVFSLGFLSCVALRVAAAIRAKSPTKFKCLPIRTDPLPKYSVLVALYKEAEMVPHLLSSLGRLYWPQSKLEILLILEDDDLETIGALQIQRLPPNVQILTVSRLGPRTKPKALSYAIPVISGEFVAIYDAEDAPHPFQLLEAWNAFRKNGERLACVQAPLHIRNGNRNLLTKHFAFEYAALFRGLLPALARNDLFFPLGGTSNHFKVAALKQVMVWDPYNVTEDADMAVRLSRFGYSLGMINAPTFEDAPDRFSVWLKQRTRWFKGWMQTFLVHGRSPLSTMRQMSFGSYIVSQILLLGIIISSMSYIFIILVLISIVAKYINIASISTFDISLLIVDTTNILLGFFAFLLLGWRTLGKPEKKGFWKIVLTLPGYWVIMSIACWRAAWQLYRQPHLWEKTPHTRPDH